VIISGRSVKDLVPLLELDPLPEIWGSHGWEHILPGGAYELAEPGETAARGLAAARDWIEQAGLAARCEYKPTSLALHWRGLEPQDIETMRQATLEGWSPIAERAGLTLHAFDGGVELRVPGRDKGVAVRTILAEIDAGASVAYLGDDQTDEDAFQAIAGRGLGILVRDEFRPTAAALWLKPPAELLDFLAHWQ
jgi:trehalose 6-phosphate phosphatase